MAGELENIGKALEESNTIARKISAIVNNPLGCNTGDVDRAVTGILVCNLDVITNLKAYLDIIEKRQEELLTEVRKISQAWGIEESSWD